VCFVSDDSDTEAAVDYQMILTEALLQISSGVSVEVKTDIKYIISLL
jgi:hypothetical protein